MKNLKLQIKDEKYSHSMTIALDNEVSLDASFNENLLTVIICSSIYSGQFNLHGVYNSE